MSATGYQCGPSDRDEQLLKLFLLEGRRIRNDGKQVVLVPGFLEFVKIVDGILQELTDQGELAVHPQALRSALMGAIEGMLRDKILARSMGYPATFSDAISARSVSHFLTRPSDKRWTRQFAADL